MLLTIKSSDGASFTVDLRSEKTIGELLVEVAQRLNINPDSIRLVTKNAYLYDHALKLSEYKLFHGQTLFVLTRVPSPTQVNLDHNTELVDTKRSIEACFAKLREETSAKNSVDTQDYFIDLLKKLSEKYAEMSEELIVCASLLSRPNNTSIPAHWKDLAAFRRKSFAVSEASCVVSAILYGSTLATSAALAQGHPQRQFIIPPTINLNWSKTFDSFGQEQKTDTSPSTNTALNDYLSSTSSSGDEEVNFPFEMGDFDESYSRLVNPDDSIFQNILQFTGSLIQNLRNLPSTMTLDKYFNISAVTGSIFYELTSRISIATALEMLSGGVNRLDESLLLLRRLLQAQSTDRHYYSMLSLQIASKWFPTQGLNTQVLIVLMAKLQKMTFDFFNAMALEIGLCALSTLSPEGAFAPHQFTAFAGYNLLSEMRQELADGAISQADWTILLRNSFTPVSQLIIIAKAFLPHLGMATTLSLLSLVLPQSQINNLSRSLLTQ